MDTLSELRLRAERRDRAGAAAYLRAELDAGRLWRVSLLSDPALAPLWEDAACRQVMEAAQDRVAARAFRPEVLIEEAGEPGVRPLLLVLHGARSTAAATLPLWRPARELGYTVAAAQSSQPATEDSFCWDPPRERVWQDLAAIAARLPAHGRVVLAGFSQGAWIALQAALRGQPFPAAGAVMIGTFVGAIANLEPASRRLRIAILDGGDDAYTESLGELRKDLSDRGHHVMVEVLPGLGHAYPDDFAARLPGLLKTVSRSAN